MRDLPSEEWFALKKIEADNIEGVYNGQNLFAIWMDECGVPDKPCPPYIDPRIWNAIQPYLHLWSCLSKEEKSIGMIKRKSTVFD